MIRRMNGEWMCRLVRSVVSVLLVVLLTHLGCGDAAMTLRLVQVVHRHGSRSAIVDYNQSQICGDVPCGYLNPAGQTMLVNTGTFLRNHYNTGSEPFFSSESYSLLVSHSRSSDVLRTLQSAEGLLRGMFPNISALFPAIHTVDKSEDWLIRSSSLAPFTYAFYRFDDYWKHEVCNPKVDTIIDFDTLQSVAKEVFSEGNCAKKIDRCNCAADLFDIGAAMEATGEISKFPLLKANLDKLRSVVVFYFAQEFGYNATDENHLKMGSQGQTVVKQLLENAQLHMQGKSTYKLYHYSGHDTTLSPLAATLGDTTPVGVLSPFAQLYAFELLYDDAANAYSMRVRRGSPGQTPESKYEFAWDDFQLKCMDSNGGVYNAAENTCPYYDFQRFVDSTKPKDPAGLCYIDDRYKSLFNCPTQPGQDPNTHCKAYRKACPAWVCPTDFTLDPLTLHCVCSAASCMNLSGGGGGEASKNGVSAGATAAIAISTFSVGAILAASVAILFWTWRGSKRACEVL